MSPSFEIGELDLRIREAGGDPEGALVLNHGRATDEDDLYPLLDLLDPEGRLLALTTGAPLRGIPPGGRHWYVVERVGYPDPGSFAEGYARLTGALDGLLSERGIDWQRTVIGGFSQGAVMSYAAAMGPDRPRPAGLIALSGFIPEVEGWRFEAERLSGLPVYVHHGSADPIIGVELGRRARGVLQGAGADLRYEETAVGHGVPQQAVEGARGLISRALEGARSEPAR